MEQFLKSLTSPAWWIGVVIVGIVINVISAYLKKPIDKVLATLSVSRRARNEQKREERDKLIKTLKADTNLLILFALSESRYRIRSILFFLVSFSFFWGTTFLIGRFDVVVIIGIIFAILSFLAGLSDHTEAMRVSSIVEDVKEKYKNII